MHIQDTVKSYTEGDSDVNAAAHKRLTLILESQRSSDQTGDPASTSSETTQVDASRLLDAPRGFVASDFNEVGENQFIALQKWVGHVTMMGEDDFIVRLTDMTNGGSDEIATIEKSDVSEDDLPLLSVGAILYLSVGKLKRRGQVFNHEILKFKRAQPWSVAEIDSISDEANALAKRVGWSNRR